MVFERDFMPKIAGCIFLVRKNWCPLSIFWTHIQRKGSERIRSPVKSICFLFPADSVLDFVKKSTAFFVVFFGHQ